MDETGKQLLRLMFRPGEDVCVSYNKYGYHSVPLEEVLNKDKVVLVPTEDSCEKRGIPWGEEAFEKVSTDKLTMVALNPIQGWREDVNCKAFRSFLVEMDTGDLKEQLDYIRRVGLPYSAVIFSGNKSLHFLVTVDRDIPNEEHYRLFSEWILNVCTMADQQTKNPSRSIRIPGAYRDEGKKQRLVEMKGAVKLEDLANWLKTKPEAKPKVYEKRLASDEADKHRVRGWVKRRLKDGIVPPDRNRQWYAVAYEYALAGYSLDGTIEALRVYFSPDRDFKEREWITTIKSAFKNVGKL